MRIVVAFFMLALMFSCKSKSTIVAGETLEYIVILKKGTKPNVLKGAIQFKVLSFNDMETKLNQWKVAFQGQPADSKKLKSSLLNHPDVISVFTLAEFDTVRSKKGKKSVQSIQGKGGVSKQ